MDNGLPQTADATVWAKEFVKACQRDPLFVLDEGAMLGWFAHAIKAGWDAAEKRHRAEVRRGSTPPATLLEKGGEPEHDSDSITYRILREALKDGVDADMYERDTLMAIAQILDIDLSNTN